MRLELFRVRVFRSDQLSMFAPELTPIELLRSAIFAAPVGPGSRGTRWAIGRPSAIGEAGAWFQIGRFKHEVAPKFEDGRYFDVDQEVAPYTDAFCDINKEVIALRASPKLTSDLVSVASALEKLFNGWAGSEGYDCEFSISRINDPSEFFDRLRKAHAVVGLSMSITPPNITDVENDFIRPNQDVVQDLGGREATVKVTGSHLKMSVIEKIGRSVAAVGERLRARIVRSRGSKPHWIALRDQRAVLEASDEALPEDILSQVSHAYESIRHGDEEGPGNEHERSSPV